MYLSGYLGESDFDSLRELGGQTIMFPGFVCGWGTEQEAIGHLSTIENNGEQKVKDVVFVINDISAFKFL